MISSANARCDRFNNVLRINTTFMFIIFLCTSAEDAQNDAYAVFLIFMHRDITRQTISNLISQQKLVFKYLISIKPLASYTGLNIKIGAAFRHV